MQEMNPNYKNYKFLAGIWKNNDGSFTADLTVPENITVNYKGASLTRSFILTQTSTMTLSGTGGCAMTTRTCSWVLKVPY